MIESLSIDPLESYSKLFARLPGFDLSCNDLLTCFTRLCGDRALATYDTTQEFLAVATVVTCILSVFCN